MRIIGYIENTSFKVTVFQDNNRISIKFENGQFEQVYKFRDGSGVDNLGQATEFVDAAFLEGVTKVFASMNQNRMLGFSRKVEGEDEEEFDEII